MGPQLSAVDRSQIGKILVIKLRHLGDVLLATPVFTHLRHAFPKAQIDALIYAETAPMLEEHVAVNTLHLCDQKWKKLPLWQRLYKEWGLLRALRRQKYDLVINLTGSERSDIAVRFCKAPYRVGWPRRKKGRSLYNLSVKRPPTDRHVVELQLDALRRIHIYPALAERRLCFAVPEHAAFSAAQKLRRTGYREGPFVLIHPTSRWLFKCVPEKSIANAILHLKEKGLQVVVTAADDAREKEMIAAIASLCPKGSFYDLAGQLHLKELGALLQRALLFIGPDSAPMHMAAALQRPVVAFFGPSSEKAWAPWDAPGNCPHVEIVAAPLSCRPCGLDGCGGGKVSDCLVRLSSATIHSAIDRALETTLLAVAR